jgi:hypothetical protein
MNAIITMASCPVSVSRLDAAKIHFSEKAQQART